MFLFLDNKYISIYQNYYYHYLLQTNTGALLNSTKVFFLHWFRISVKKKTSQLNIFSRRRIYQYNEDDFQFEFHFLHSFQTA